MERGREGERGREREKRERERENVGELNGSNQRPYARKSAAYTCILTLLRFRQITHT